MLKRALVLAAACAVGLTFILAGGALAGGGYGGTVTCTGSDPTPGCTVGVSTPGKPGGPTTSPPSAAPGTGTGVAVCRSPGGTVVPCSLPGYGWLGANGCYYRLDTTWKPPPGDTADLPPAGQAGAYYDESCLDVPGTGEAIVWLKAGAPGTGPPPSAAQLGQQATSALVLRVGQIGTSPAATVDQLVNVPTWLWLAGWAPVVARAAVPGLSVTATATPVSATWTFGDGTHTVCTGPGTPYTAAYAAAHGPAAASPICGHTYARSSAGQPGGAFAVSVTVSWAIRWAGGGQAGTEPALTSTATTTLRVAESQALNTNPTS